MTPTRVRAAIAALAVVLIGSVAAAIIGSDTNDEPTWDRPFAATSIWYRKVPNDADLVDAELPEAENILLDRVLLRRLRADDPDRPVLQPGSWTHRCSGTEETGTSVPIPDDWIVSDAKRRDDGGFDTPNNVAAFLLPDGRTIEYLNGVARCQKGGPLFAYRTGEKRFDTGTLGADGRLGSHGGSRLSPLGGAIRPGELSGNGAVDHTLDLLVWARHLHFGGSRDQAFRWPAESADSYASASTYQGTNPALRMGSLLALPRSVSPRSLGIETDVGEKLFRAMQDYGGYVTDDSGWDAYMLSVDEAAIGSFEWGSAEEADLNRIMAAVHVVDDNAPR
jgi:hypothetical protein